MRALTILLLLGSLSVLAVDEQKNEQQREPASVSSEEVNLPDTVDISKDIIEINKNYIRDIASGENKNENVESGKVEFWSFED